MGGAAGTIIYFAVIAALFYFLFIRPSAQRQRQQQQLLSSLAVGDRVVTAGGIYGSIRELAEEVVRIEVAPGVVIDVARGAIGKRLDIAAPVENAEIPERAEMPEDASSEPRE